MTRQEFIHHASAQSIQSRKKRKSGSSDFIMPGAKRAAVPKRSLRVSKETTLIELFQDWHYGTGGSVPFLQLTGKVRYLDEEDSKLFFLCKLVSEAVSRSESPKDTLNKLEAIRLVRGLSAEDFVASGQKDMSTD